MPVDFKVFIHVYHLNLLFCIKHPYFKDVLSFVHPSVRKKEGFMSLKPWKLGTYSTCVSCSAPPLAYVQCFSLCWCLCGLFLCSFSPVPKISKKQLPFWSVSNEVKGMSRTDLLLLLWTLPYTAKCPGHWEGWDPAICSTRKVWTPTEGCSSTAAREVSFFQTV